MNRDSECIFCKIVAEEIPSIQVYEDEHFLSFIDINPLSPGHVQVIPKEHFRFVWDIPDSSSPSPHIGEYFTVVRNIARAMKGTFETEYIFSKVMGDEVPHAHVWLFPNPQEASGDKMDFQKNAELIRKNLSP